MNYGFAQIKISDVKFTAAREDEAATGLTGWVTCTLNGNIRFDCIAVRRTADGRSVLSFPAHHDSAGRRHFYVRPMDNIARMEIERQVFQALGLKDGA